MMHSITIIRAVADWYPFAKCIMDKDGNCPIHYVLMCSDLNSIEMRNMMEELNAKIWN